MVDTNRVGDWLETYSGIMYYPLDPRPEEITVEDIAHALSNMCRYAGHCRRFYSVAEHSVLVSRIVDPEFALPALLHDATEAYLVDVPRPIKRHLKNYEEIEQLNWLAIADRFGLDRELPEQVKFADNAILVKEMSLLLRSGRKPTSVRTDQITVPDDVVPVGMWPDWAKQTFLKRFDELYNQ